MVIFVELLKGVRKDVVVRKYKKGLEENGCNTSSLEVLDVLENNCFRTLVLSLDVPVTLAKRVVDIGSKYLKGLCDAVTPHFRMVVEYNRNVFEGSSATDLYRFADIHNSKNTWDKVNNISVDNLFIKRVHSMNRNVAFLATVKNISKDLYLRKDKDIVNEVMKLQGVIKVITA